MSLLWDVEVWQKQKDGEELMVFHLRQVAQPAFILLSCTNQYSQELRPCSFFYSFKTPDSVSVQRNVNLLLQHVNPPQIKSNHVYHSALKHAIAVIKSLLYHSSYPSGLRRFRSLLGVRLDDGGGLLTPEYRQVWRESACSISGFRASEMAAILVRAPLPFHCFWWSLINTNLLGFWSGTRSCL